MSPQLRSLLKNNMGNVDEEALYIMAAALTSLAKGLEALQQTGLIKFPAGPFTAVEIESRLDKAICEATDKFLSFAPNASE